MVRDIKPLLSSETPRDRKRLFSPTQIPRPTLETRDEAALMVGRVYSEIGEGKPWICARGQGSFDGHPLTGTAQHMHIVPPGESCRRLPADATLRTVIWMTGYRG